MKIYNTKTRTIEKIIPHQEGEIKLYTCGPTVYHYAHIGNLRTYIMEDVLEKALTYLGYKVTRVMNITDVGHLTSDADSGDDKMVKSAEKEKKTVLDIAEYYTDAFWQDAKKLNITKPEIVSNATDNIDEYIKIIEKLIATDYAYITGDNVYFDTSKVKEYYALTNQNESDLLEGARDTVEKDDNKKNKTDFVLWFTKSKFKDQELKWESPWGLGYPGWHIECSGICIKYLGEYLDIHCGGVDNIFPHHTNEIAQSEAYLGSSWCKYWFHAEHLNDESGKMSKSHGETLTINTLIEKGYDPLSYRFLCLSSHYRNQLTFTYEALDGATNAYKKLKNKIQNLKPSETLDEEAYTKYDNEFKGQLENNLNTANAITLIFDLLSSDVNDKTKLTLIDAWDKVLSLNLIEKNSFTEEEKKEIEDAIKKRQEAKEKKDFNTSDIIRDELLAKGIVLEDTKEGTKYKRQ